MAGRSVFCGTFPGVAPGLRYRPFCPLESGLSSAPLTLDTAIIWLTLTANSYSRQYQIIPLSMHKQDVDMKDMTLSFHP